MQTMEIEKPNQRVQPQHTQLFINNEFVNSEDGQTFQTINPATEAVLANVQRAGPKDAEKAVQAAKKAFNGEWRKWSAHQRGKVMLKLAELMEQNQHFLADLESQDSGKPISFSTNVDLGLAIKCIRYYAGLCDKIQGETIPIEGDYFCYTRKEPVGICGQIIPWNFPILMLSWKWGPCLASGSVTILKSSEKTPLTALAMAALAREAGFPPGVIQVLSGYGDVGQYLVEHPEVDKIAFTGSTNVGYLIQQKCSGKNLKRITLELGGKSPNIICHDADLKVAVESAKLGVFLNQGQCCIAGSRVYCHESIYDKFVAAIVEQVKQIKVGDPFANGTDQGPQVDEIQFKSVMKYIESGKQEGAKLEIGGGRLGDKGYYVQPTVFSNVQEDMKISQEEIFGPVMQIAKFSSYEEVIAKANNTKYGLGAGIVTQSIGTYQKLANAIRAGTIYVNCYDIFDCNTPFGGFKASGLGRELGIQGVQNYLENKTIIVKRDEGTLP